MYAGRLTEIQTETQRNKSLQFVNFILTVTIPKFLVLISAVKHVPIFNFLIHYSVPEVHGRETSWVTSGACMSAACSGGDRCKSPTFYFSTLHKLSFGLIIDMLCNLQHHCPLHAVKTVCDCTYHI